MTGKYIGPSLRTEKKAHEIEFTFVSNTSVLI
jgi:hypothetical protein